MSQEQYQDTLKQILQTLKSLNTNVSLGFEKMSHQMELGFGKMSHQMELGFGKMSNQMELGFGKMNDGLDEVKRQLKFLSKTLDRKIKKKNFMTNQDSNSSKSRKIAKQANYQRRKRQIRPTNEPEQVINNEEIVNEVMIEQANEVGNLRNDLQNQKSIEQLGKKLKELTLDDYFKIPKKQENALESQNRNQSHSDEENRPNDENN